MSWAFKQSSIPTVPRFVLLAMADHANEDDESWPSVVTLARKTGMTERAARFALRTLETIGAISATGETRGVRADRMTRVYRLHTERTFTDAGGTTFRGEPRSGGNITTARGEPRSPKPSIEPSSHSGVVSKDARGSRLPPDWKPSDDLMAWAAKARPDVDAWAEAESFRDYWHSKPGAGARKTDWGLTFRNWIRRSRAARPDARAGVPAGTTPANAELSQWRARLRSYRPGGYWPATWGPRPGEPGCEVPASVLLEYNLVKAA